MIRINEDLCTGCGACVSDCISGVLSITQGKAHVCDECLQCGHCIAICPQAAPSISVYSDELIEYHSETFDIPTQNMLNTIKFRRSVRQFKEQLLSYDDLHLLIDAAAHTPTAKNAQACRFVFIQDSLEDFKRTIWSNLRSAFEEQRVLPIPRESVQNFLNLREGEHPQDYLFRNAPAVLCIQAPDPVDAGLAASAIEMVGTTLGIGVLYNGYLRRTIAAMEDIQAYLDMDLEEKPLVVCMLMGYSDVKYQRTAPRRNPSVVLR
ncbi:MAG: nitroreductase family protein [Eggerthellaceae bacterium]|nr:nitroreductase family protein [Eggerthellaceae bacterium]